MDSLKVFIWNSTDRKMLWTWKRMEEMTIIVWKKVSKLGTIS